MPSAPSAAQPSLDDLRHQPASQRPASGRAWGRIAPIPPGVGAAGRRRRRGLVVVGGPWPSAQGGRPATRAKKLASDAGSGRPSTTVSLAPASRNARPARRASIAVSASSTVAATTTPLPAASVGLTPIGALPGTKCALGRGGSSKHGEIRGGDAVPAAQLYGERWSPPAGPRRGRAEGAIPTARKPVDKPGEQRRLRPDHHPGRILSRSAKAQEPSTIFVGPDADD